MNDPPIYTLMDFDDVVHVKPCRKCGHEPIFFWADRFDATNMYYIKCPNCGAEKIADHLPEAVEKAWNDWSGSLEEWIEKEYVDWWIDKDGDVVCL